MIVQSPDHNDSKEDSESGITNSESNSLQSATGKRKRCEMVEETKRKKIPSSEESIIHFLEKMHKDIKEVQKEVLDQLKRQHEQKKNEN